MSKIVYIKGVPYEAEDEVVWPKGAPHYVGEEEGVTKSIHHILNQSDASDFIKVVSVFAVASIFRKKTIENQAMSRREFINPLKWLRF